MPGRFSNIVTFAGGVGGAKLIEGLAGAGSAPDVTAIVNTADDFERYGLWISPDIDSVVYALAGLSDRQRGWGIEGDTTTVLDAIRRYDPDTWFLIGDQDFATHIIRTAGLKTGKPLSTVVRQMTRALGIDVAILPMSDQPVHTEVETERGWLEFQEYFVRHQHELPIRAVRFRDVEHARPAPGVFEAIRAADLVIICPSNPIVSIGPILAVDGIRDAILASPAQKVAVSPLIAGKAVKGPAEDMMRAYGFPSNAVGVAQAYAALIDTLVIDEQDAGLAADVEAEGIRPVVLQTIMGDRDDRIRLAEQILKAIE